MHDASFGMNSVDSVCVEFPSLRAIDGNNNSDKLFVVYGGSVGFVRAHVVDPVDIPN